jgi:anti-sigma B factor antagonist
MAPFAGCNPEPAQRVPDPWITGRPPVCPVEGHAEDSAEGGGVFLLWRRINGVVVLTVSGEIDMATAPRMAVYVEHCLDRAGTRPAVLDLDAVWFLGASGLSVLAEAHAHARRRGVDLRVVASTRAVVRPLQVIQLHRVLRLYPTLPAAVADVADVTG